MCQRGGLSWQWVGEVCPRGESWQRAGRGGLCQSGGRGSQHWVGRGEVCRRWGGVARPGTRQGTEGCVQGCPGIGWGTEWCVRGGMGPGPGWGTEGYVQWMGGAWRGASGGRAERAHLETSAMCMWRSCTQSSSSSSSSASFSCESLMPVVSYLQGGDGVRLRHPSPQRGGCGAVQVPGPHPPQPA